MAAVSDALRASIDGRTPAEWATIRAEAARDRNYVHPVERRAFEQLLAKHDVARHESLSEKFILCCLFARKLDVDRTAELLRRHLALRRHFGCEKPVRFRDIGHALRHSGSAFTLDFKRDRFGRAIVYNFPGRFFPKQYGERDELLRTMWAVDRWVRVETLDAFREGVVLVQCLHGLSFANRDDPDKRKKRFEVLGGALPVRMRAIVFVDPNVFVRTIASVVSSKFPPKIGGRFEFLTRAELQERVTADNLLADVGGNVRVQFEELARQYEREDRELDDLEAARASANVRAEASALPERLQESPVEGQPLPPPPPLAAAGASYRASGTEWWDYAAQL